MKKDYPDTVQCPLCDKTLFAEVQMLDMPGDRVVWQCYCQPGGGTPTYEKPIRPFEEHTRSIEVVYLFPHLLGFNDGKLHFIIRDMKPSEVINRRQLLGTTAINGRLIPMYNSKCQIYLNKNIKENIKKEFIKHKLEPLVFPDLKKYPNYLENYFII